MINLLNFPRLYNLRFLVAGNQKLTRDYITKYYRYFNCHSVIDIGCGTGDFTPLFSKKEYLGIDINPRYIAYAQKHYSYRFICHNVIDYDFKNYKFDASLFISTFHHLSDTQSKIILKKTSIITRKIIIIIDLNPETSLIKKFLIRLDRGNYVRTTKEKIALLSPYGKIIHVSHFSSGLASQTGMILLPNYEKNK